MRFSFFRHFFDNLPEPCDVGSWDEFVRIMHQISEVEGYKPEAGDYENRQPLISSAIYAEAGMKRCNANVSGWDMLIMDIDDTSATLDYIQKKFSVFTNIMYSSASCTHSKLKLRVVIPLDKFAPKDKLSQIWFAAQKWAGGLNDEQTKDLSRMHYQPARYTNKGEHYRHFFLVNKGISLPWETLIEKYPSPPPEDRFKRSNPLKNLKRDIFKSNNPLPDFNIQSDECPFVYDAMVRDYVLTPAGGHHKAIYMFMVKICYNAQKIDYPITNDEIVDMARQLDQLDGGWYDEKKLYDSANDAMDYVGV